VVAVVVDAAVSLVQLVVLVSLLSNIKCQQQARKYSIQQQNGYAQMV
jgi:hypothetical protein